MSNSLQSNGLANPMDTSGSSVLHYFLEFAQIHVHCKKEEKTITNDRVGITDSMYMNLRKLWDMMKDRDTWQAVVVEVTKSGTQLNDSTTTTISIESGCYMIISSSASLLSFCHQSFPASGYFLMIQLVESGGQSTGATPLASVFPMNIQGWFPLGLRTIGELSIQLSSVTQSCPTLCDPMNGRMPGLPVHHKLTEFTQTHAHRVHDAIQPSHPLSSHLLLPPVLPSIRVFSNESTLHMRWPKYWSFNFNISPSMKTQDLSPSGWTGWISLQSKGPSRVFSNTIVQKHQFFGAHLSSQSTLRSIHDHWKNHNLDQMDLFCKVMFLAF